MRALEDALADLEKSDLTLEQQLLLMDLITEGRLKGVLEDCFPPYSRHPLITEPSATYSAVRLAGLRALRRG